MGIPWHSRNQLSLTCSLSVSLNLGMGVCGVAFWYCLRRKEEVAWNQCCSFHLLLGSSRWPASHHTVSSAKVPSQSPQQTTSCHAVSKWQPEWGCCGFAGVTKRVSNDPTTELFLFKGNREREDAATVLGYLCRCVE